MGIFPAKDLLRAYAMAGDVVKFQKLNSLLAVCPDLMVYEDGAGSIFLASKQVNSIANQVRFRMDGDGAPCVVYIYTVVPYEGRVYSDPPWLVIGHGALMGFGIVPTDTWLNEAKQARLPKETIKTISNYLEKRPPILYGG